MAQRDPSTAFQSKIYPPGAEYALAHAESQCMSAVTGVLTESLTETLKGFYKLRKAYSTLLELSAAEKKYLDSLKNQSKVSLRSTGTGKSRSTRAKSVHSTTKNDDDDDDDDDKFEDAHDEADGGAHLDQDLSKLKIDSNTAVGDDEFDFRNVSSDPIDIFIHSGMAMCFGIFQLVLALLPPPVAKFLAFLSFKGDKQTGIRLLWSATNFKENINGAIAAFVVAVYHNALLFPGDILRDDDLPVARLKALLEGMEPYCRGSGLYTLESSRMVAIQKNLPGALSILGDGPKSPLRQVEAFKVFETSFLHLYQHHHKECAESFLACVELNNWAHGMYYYIAAASYVELYRKAKDTEAAPAYAAEAERLFELAISKIGVKKVLGSKIPLDIFMQRKIAKWQNRARVRNCSLVDAIGVSPAMEMIYLWSGFKKMQPGELQETLKSLVWSESASKDAASDSEPMDEQALLALLKSAVLRNLGEVEEAQKLLEESVMCYEPYQLKACDNGDEWPAPTAYYERAVCFWQQAGGQNGPRDLLERCSEDLAKVEKAVSQDLEVMLGLKLKSARDALRRSGVGK